MHGMRFDRRTAIGAAAGAIANSFVSSPSGSTITQQARATETVQPRAASFKVGTQNDSSDVALEVLAAFGVNNICSNLPSAKFDDAWSVDGLKQLRNRVESYGLKLDMVPLPLSSVTINKSENPNILLGKSPERDREIDNICQMIRNAARRRNSGAQIQHEHSGRRAFRAVAGPRRGNVRHFQLRQSGGETLGGENSAHYVRRILGTHYVLSRARRAGGRGTQSCGWPAIRTIPACPPTKVTAACTPRWGASRD